MSVTRATLFCDDAIHFLKSCPDNFCDCIVTDPAYESLEKHRKIGTTTRLKHSKSSSNDWFPIFPNDKFLPFFKQCFRVLKNNTHMYVYSDQESLFVMKPAAEAAGFKFWKFLIWDYVNIGMGYHYRNRHQVILFLEKGKRKLNSMSISDIITVKRVMNGYPTEKPVKVSAVLIEQSTKEKELVLDPFMGSGSVGVAALQLDRMFVGCDIKQEAVDIAEKRLNDCVF
jgi:site-specific DNA-methyltransferase (adenine-specific)